MPGAEHSLWGREVRRDAGGPPLADPLAEIYQAALSVSLEGGDVAARVDAAVGRMSAALMVPLRLELGHGPVFGSGAAEGRCLHSGPAKLWVSLRGEIAAGCWSALEHALAAIVAADTRCRQEDGLQKQLADALADAQAAKARVGRREGLLRGLFDLSPIGILLVDQDSEEVLDANDAFLAFGAWERAAVVGGQLQDLLPEEALKLRVRALEQLQSNRRFGPFENRFKRPDGSEYPAVIRGMTLPETGGRRIVWVLVEDVSAHHDSLALVQAHRDEAQRARDELAAALEALPHGLVIFDADDRVVLCNDNMRRIFPGMADLFVPGARHEEILRGGLARGMFPQEASRPEAFVAEVETARQQHRFERLTELSDGRLVQVIEVAIPSGGRIGLRIDVTAEREASRRLAEVIEGSQSGTWEVDLISGRNVVNDRWAEMLGWQRKDLEPITTETWRSLIHPQDAPEVVASVERMLAGKVDRYEHTYRMRHAEGHWVWINDRGRVSSRDQAGRPTRMAGVHVDVSALKDAEQRLEDIIDGAEVGTWQYNTRTGENRINRKWAELLGYTLEELAPMDSAGWQALLHPEDHAALLDQQEHHLREGQIRFRNEIRLRHKDGHWVWILSRGRVTTWDDDGGPLIMSGVHLDISARKELETAFRAERDFLAQLMETSVSGIMAVDVEGRVVFCNAEVSRQLELPIEALLGQVCDPVLLGLTDFAGQAIGLAEMPCQCCLASASGLVRDHRLRLRHPDGREKVLSVNAARTHDPAQKAAVVLTVTDITAAAEAEARLRLATERAEAANRAKSQFLANMSHELRTPLNGVLGMADLLTGQEASEDRDRMVATIRDSASHLLSIVNDILDLAKVESGSLTLTPVPLDLMSLSERAMAMHRITAERKGITLRVDVDPALQGLRLADQQRVLQILHNVLGNAVKFTEAGGVSLRLEPGPGNLVRFIFADTGIGMSEAEQARVFDEFTQADGTITRRFGGTGLGLSIVRRLVGLMQGQIMLDSAKGRGTTLVIDLPMPRAVPLSVEDESRHPLDAAPLRGLRALVAEDNATNQIILRSMLMRLGVQVQMVGDGASAVAAWEPGRFDLLLLDISMPGTDGLTALDELRAKAGPDGLPPALAVTANAMTHHLNSYRAAGFAGVIAKPVRLDDLTMALLAAARRDDCPAFPAR